MDKIQHGFWSMREPSMFRNKFRLKITVINTGPHRLPLLPFELIAFGAFVIVKTKMKLHETN